MLLGQADDIAVYGIDFCSLIIQNILEHTAAVLPRLLGHREDPFKYAIRIEVHSLRLGDIHPFSPSPFPPFFITRWGFAALVSRR